MKGCASLRSAVTGTLHTSTKEQRGTVVGAERGSDALLLLESRPKGSASAQLGVASSGSLLISRDSSWHAWESILEGEQDGLAS